MWHRMVSYKMRIHTWPLDGKRKFVERSRLFRMPPRDMAIACLSGWELKKSSWQILTFPKHRPATSWPSCCMMVACATVPGKANINREVSPFFDQPWQPHAMDVNLHGSLFQGCLPRSLFLSPAPFCFGQK